MKSFVVLSWPTRKTMVRPSGGSTAAGPTSIASDPGRSRARSSRGSPAPVRCLREALRPWTWPASGLCDNYAEGDCRGDKEDPRERTLRESPRGWPPAGSGSRVTGGKIGLAGGASRDDALERERASPMSRSRCLGSRSRQRRAIAAPRRRRRGKVRPVRSLRAGPRPACRRRCRLERRAGRSASRSSTTPNAQMSARWSTVLPRACSGAM